MKNYEELINEIELLKQALLFYADGKNYLPSQYDSSVCHINPQSLKPMINVDNGEQARFALKRLQETLDLNQEMQDEYIKEIQEKIEVNKPPEGVLRLIEELRKTNEDGNIK